VENISSTLRDSRSGSRGGAGTMLCRTPQGVSINCRRGEQLERHAAISATPHPGACAAMRGRRGLQRLPEMSYFVAEF
jgi:hypothetical protein